MGERFIVAGGGPVALTAALLLAKAGKQVLVLEKDQGLHTDWRASTFHSPSLEMAEELGVIDRMLDQGLVAEKFQFRHWSRNEAVEFDMSQLADVTKYPFRLQLEQYKYTRILFEELKQNYSNAEIRFSNAIQDVKIVDGKAVLTVEHTKPSDYGRSEEIECDWLLACDGANSRVRRSLNLAFDGTTYPERSLLLSIDAPFEEWYPGICWVNYIADSEESPGMLLKIPDIWRVSFRVPDNVSDEEAVSDDYVNQRVRGVFGDRDIPSPTERQVFKVHQRAAETFRRGPVLLCGDAAHLNSPYGGQGLNSGIHDAYDAVTTLLDHLDGKVPESGLDDYSNRRRNAAVNEVQRISHRNTTEFGSKDQATISTSMQRAKMIAADPALARKWMMEASMLESVRPWYDPAQKVFDQTA